MKVLLDTHVAIWSLVAPTRIRSTTRAILKDTSNDVYVSSVSILEIAIKFALKKVSSPPFSAARALELFHGIGYQILNVSGEHAAATEQLPFLHGDPFDRLLMAQALSEPLRFVTGDRRLFAYSDTIIRV